MLKLKQFLRNTAGTSAVEFAILAPIFIAGLFSMIGYSIYLSTSTSIQQVTAEAARAAVAGLSARERQTLAEQATSMAVKDLAFIDPKKIKVTISGQETDRYTVQVSYDASELPIWSLFTYAFPNSKSISRTAVMRVGAAS